VALNFKFKSPFTRFDFGFWSAKNNRQIVISIYDSSAINKSLTPAYTYNNNYDNKNYIATNGLAKNQNI